MTADSPWRRLGAVITHTGPAYNALDAALARVLDLHQPYRTIVGDERCTHCRSHDGRSLPYPCPTIQALNGDQP